MKKQKLIKYMKSIYEMESSLFMIDDLLTQMEEKSKSIRSNKETPIYAYEEKPKFFTEDYKNYFAISVFFGIAGLFVFSGWNTFFPAEGFAIILSFIVGNLIRFIIGYLIGAVLFTIIHYISYNVKIKKWKKNNSETDRINSSIVEQNKRENALYQQKANLLDKEISELKEKYNDTLDLLNAYYDFNIIYPKHRNLIAISSIYEYLLSGKCHELTGPGGAYATYDLESRLDYIIVQFDEVIEKLDQIQSNQYQLYDAINNGFKQSNALLNDIVNGVDRLESSQELNNYYNRITARNSEYFKMVHFYNGTI